VLHKSVVTLRFACWPPCLEFVYAFSVIDCYCTLSFEFSTSSWVEI